MVSFPQKMEPKSSEHFFKNGVVFPPEFAWTLALQDGKDFFI